MQVLAADPTSWTDLYLAALTQAGVLRPEDVPPAVQQDPEVISLIATLAAGILAGPGRQQIITTATSPQFFAQVDPVVRQRPDPDEPVHRQPVRRQRRLSRATSWPATRRRPAPSTSASRARRTPSRSTSTSTTPTTTTWTTITDSSNPENPNYVPVQPPNFSPFFTDGSTTGPGPTGRAVSARARKTSCRRASPCPTRSSSATRPRTSTVGQIRIVSQLDPNLDPRSFRLGDLQIGDLQVHIPNTVGSFQGDFDFTQSKGFILRVSAGIDVQSDTVTWLLQAIDPATGEVITDPTAGLLPPGSNASGFVTYTVEPLAGLATGTQISAQARVLFDTSAPQDTNTVTNTVDSAAPTTTLTATPIVAGRLRLPGAVDRHRRQRRLGRPGRDGLRLGGRRRLPDLARPDDRDLGHLQRPARPHLSVPGAGDRQRRQPRAAAVGRLGAQRRLAGQPGRAADRARRPRTDLGTPAPAQHPAVDQPAVHPGAAGDPRTGAGQPAQRVPDGPPAVQRHGRSPPASPRARPTSARWPSSPCPTARRWSAAARTATSSSPSRSRAARRRRPWPPSRSRSTTWRSTPPATSGPTTGGGPLLELDPQTGAVLGQYGDSLTQTLAIQPGTGLIYVSSGERHRDLQSRHPDLQPLQRPARRQPGLRPGRLALGGDLAPGPERRGRVRPEFHQPQPDHSAIPSADDAPVRRPTSTRSPSACPAPSLAGLLFISHDEEAQPGAGDRADDGRPGHAPDRGRGHRRHAAATRSRRRRWPVLISQSHQVDVLSPVVRPARGRHQPARTARPSRCRSAPSASPSTTTCSDGPTDPHSVLNPANYQLTGDTAGPIAITPWPTTRPAGPPSSRSMPSSPAATRSRSDTSIESTDGLGLAQAVLGPLPGDRRPLVAGRHHVHQRPGQRGEQDLLVQRDGHQQRARPCCSRPST